MMLVRSSSLLARPVARNLRALPNGLLSQRSIHKSSNGAMKVLLAKNSSSTIDNNNNPNITTLKEVYQHSYQLSATSIDRVLETLAMFSGTNPSPAFKILQAGMPQLIPFFFVNQVVFGFTFMVMLIYIMSKYFLPRFVRTFAARLFISKL